MLPTKKGNLTNKNIQDVEIANIINQHKNSQKELKRIDEEYDSDSNTDNEIELQDEYKGLQNQMNEMFVLNDELSGFLNESFLKNNDYYYINNLEQNLNAYLDNNPFPKKINVCPYQINNTGLKPFLQYFLRKYPETNHDTSNQIDFISFETNKTRTFNDIVKKCYKILEVIFLSYTKISRYSYKGFIERHGEIYIFYDCTVSNIGTHCLNSTNDLWLTLIDEIVNIGNVCNFKINENVTKFFIDSPEFIYLKDLNDNNIEIPIVAYTGRENHQIYFVTVFGVGRTTDDYEAFMGEYFYFTNFDKAFHSILNKKYTNKINKFGIIRFALFLGNMKVPNNSINDSPDLSEKTQELLKEDITATTEKYRNIRNLLRVSDRDGKWIEHYDSVYIGKFISDDGTINNISPYWVIKNYEQQTSLTYHILKSQIIDENVNYII
jgi:hypothetical protein